MENDNWVNKPGKAGTNLKLRKMMKCFCSGEQLQIGDMVPAPDSPATKDYTASVRSSRAGEAEHKLDTGNIEEAESSLRESGGALNYEVPIKKVFLVLLPHPLSVNHIALLSLPFV